MTADFSPETAKPDEATQKLFFYWKEKLPHNFFIQQKYPSGTMAFSDAGKLRELVTSSPAVKEGVINTDPEDITRKIRKYYKPLYTHNFDRLDTMGQFLGNNKRNYQKNG